MTSEQDNIRGPAVQLKLPDGRQVWLRPGALIGRLRSAAARIDDPRVSEAHALISLRGRQMRMLALRGMLRTRAGPVDEVPLGIGGRIELAREVWVEVLAIALPPTVLALRGIAITPLELRESVHALTPGPPPRLSYRHDPSAPVHIWQDGEGWRLHRQGEDPEPLQAGMTFALGQTTVSVIEVPLAAAATAETQRSIYRRPAMRLIARHETVHIHQEGRPTVTLEGNAARILSELIRFNAPTPWDWVAAEVWGKDVRRETLRIRWDRNLRTLRARLKERGLPRDMVRSDGHGNIELVLLPEDQIVDET